MDDSLATLPARLRALRKEIREEYLQPHSRPWIIGFSGGKDSTLVAQLVIEALQSISPDERKRRVVILSNDTRVESPPYAIAVHRTLERMREGLAALNLPVEVVQTRPIDDWSFWVNLLGKGYPAPNRTFRWCTDRMKIRPTSKFIQEQVSAAGEVILLLGVRKAESSARAQRIQAYSDKSEGSRLNPHNDIRGCLIFRPIVELSDDDVWHALMSSRPPWGGDHRGLWTLYRNASGGECPFVMSQADTPSCGSGSSRFGCWTCTVVEKDNSLTSLIDAGFEHLEPLAHFRERLKEMSNLPQFRSKTRRNGQSGLGPLTLEARRLLLEELLAIRDHLRNTHEDGTDDAYELISDHEVRMIREQWLADESTEVIRDTHQRVRAFQESQQHLQEVRERTPARMEDFPV